LDWMSQLGGILQQYGGADPNRAPSNVDDDFDQVTQAAPRDAISDGLSTAFRSEQTPPFGDMLGQLFNQSGGQQKASILNTLIRALGPAVVSQILARRGAGGLAGMLGGGQEEVTPEQAEQIPPEAVQDIAAQAEREDPSIIDQLSDIYARQPTLIKVLGGAALTVALAKIAQRANGR